MNAKTQTGQDLGRIVAIACVLALLVSAGVWWVFSAAMGTTVTAYFKSGVGVYSGGTVRVLGVQVGTIDSVEPEPSRVKVQMTLDDGVDVPADATAVVILPSVVSDRYIQLPSYSGGPKLEQNATIGLARTKTPTEIDDVYRTLDQLSTTLGPSGANKNGAVSDLLDTGAANLAGNGQNIRDTLRQLGDAAETLNTNKGDLFTTVDNLAKFTTALQQSDAQVREFSSRVTDVSRFLNSEGGNLRTTVRELGGTLARVQQFVKQNRGSLKSNVDNLTQVTRTLAGQRSSLAELFDTAPLALGNLMNAYNASSGTLDTRPYLQELTEPPLVALCKAIENVDPKGGLDKVTQPVADACKSVSDLVRGVVKLPTLAQVLQGIRTGRFAFPQVQPDALSAILSSTNGPASSVDGSATGGR